MYRRIPYESSLRRITPKYIYFQLIAMFLDNNQERFDLHTPEEYALEMRAYGRKYKEWIPAPKWMKETVTEKLHKQYCETLKEMVDEAYTYQWMPSLEWEYQGWRFSSGGTPMNLDNDRNMVVDEKGDYIPTMTEVRFGARSLLWNDGNYMVENIESQIQAIGLDSLLSRYTFFPEIPENLRAYVRYLEEGPIYSDSTNPESVREASRLKSERYVRIRGLAL